MRASRMRNTLIMHVQTFVNVYDYACAYVCMHDVQCAHHQEKNKKIKQQQKNDTEKKES